MKVLWLASWYPNKINETNGDFVQRQATATALFCKVDVIHVEADANNQLQENIIRTQTVHNNLTETIVLYKKTVLSVKLYSFLKYLRLFKTEVKNYISKNGLPDIVHVHVPMKAGIIAMWIKRKYNIPYVVTEHWTIYSDNSISPYKKKDFLFKFFTKKIFKSASYFLPVSNNLAELVSKQVAPTSYKIVFNVADTNVFNYEEPISDHSFTFIHVSTLNYQKNPEIIIDAFASFHQSYPTSRLFLVGNLTNKLREYIRHKKLSDRELRAFGFVEYNKVALLMRRSSAFVLFSRYENMPCVLLEALCCGLPVITSNAGGVSEVIDKQNGIIVNDYTEIALINAMKNMHDNFHQYNKKDISDKAIQMFSYETIGRQIKNIYEEVIPDKHASQH